MLRLIGAHTLTSSLTRSLPAVPTTTLLASRLSKASSDFSCPAAPGSGGKLDSPSSKLGDGGLGGGGGDWGVALCTAGNDRHKSQYRRNANRRENKASDSPWRQ